MPHEVRIVIEHPVDSEASDYAKMIHGAIVPYHPADLTTALSYGGQPPPKGLYVLALDSFLPPGKLHYWKSNFFESISDDAIEVFVHFTAKTPSRGTFVWFPGEHLHRAAARVGPADSAFAHRGHAYNFSIFSIWSDPKDTEQNLAWTPRLLGSHGTVHGRWDVCELPRRRRRPPRPRGLWAGIRQIGCAEEQV
jgi:hypothetical protein